MLGTLTTDQCKYILTANHIGRIGCTSGKKVMIVPVTYVFEDDSIYGYSLNGTKINMMRKNPNVCFQVDIIQDLANWRSVIAHGVFEELTSANDRRKVEKIFEDRIQPLRLGETLHPSREMANPPHRVQKNQKPVLYRILIKEISGRFEKSVPEK